MDMVDRHPTDWRARLENARHDRRVRSLLLALAAGLILVVLIAATNAVTTSARSISDDASALSRTDESIRAATVARTLTVLAAVAANDGTTAPSTDEITDAVAILRTDPSPTIDSLRVAIDDAVATLETGAVPLPEQIAAVENAFGEVIDEKLAERERLAVDLGDSENRLNQIASFASLALLFVVPTLAIGVYRAITKPDIENQALAHAAVRANTTHVNRLAAMTGGVESVRTLLRLGSPEVVTDQRLAEVAALAGAGADGGIRRRTAIDARTAAASAVNRVEFNEPVPIAGRAPIVSVDEAQFVTMLACLAGTLVGRRSPGITLDGNGTNALIRLTCGETIPELHHASASDPFDDRLTTLNAERIAAARTLATDLGVEISPIDGPEGSGYEVLVPVSDTAPVDVASAAPQLVNV